MPNSRFPPISRPIRFSTGNGHASKSVRYIRECGSHYNHHYNRWALIIVSCLESIWSELLPTVGNPTAAGGGEYRIAPNNMAITPALYLKAIFFGGNRHIASQNRYYYKPKDNTHYIRVKVIPKRTVPRLPDLYSTCYNSQTYRPRLRIIEKWHQEKQYTKKMKQTLTSNYDLHFYLAYHTVIKENTSKICIQGRKSQLRAWA